MARLVVAMLASLDLEPPVDVSTEWVSGPLWSVWRLAILALLLLALLLSLVAEIGFAERGG
ncbi:MAG: hypothetical protein QXS85_05215 [Acidilobaceae archaeon]